MEHSMKLFKRGRSFSIQLFLDFEDWRVGTRGLNINGDFPPQKFENDISYGNYYNDKFNNNYYNNNNNNNNYKNGNNNNNNNNNNGSNNNNNNNDNSSLQYKSASLSAYFSPFHLPSSTSSIYDIPSYLSDSNQGLVLDRNVQYSQLYKQNALISDLNGEIQFLTDHAETAVTDFHLRSRKDVYRKVRT